MIGGVETGSAMTAVLGYGGEDQSQLVVCSSQQNESAASGYSVNSEAMLTVQDQHNLKDQDMLITAENDFTKQELKAKAKKTSSSSSSGSKWWIALIVVGALIVIGIIGFIIYKNKSKKNNVDPLLGNAS